MSLGSVLKAGREDKGWTRQHLAELIGVNVNSVAKYERAGEGYGQYPPFPVLAKLVSVLELNALTVLAEGLEEGEEKQKMLEPVAGAGATMISIYNTVADMLADVDTGLEHAREQIRRTIGSPANLPDHVLDDVTGEYPYAIYTTDEVAKAKKKNGPDG